MKNCTEAHRAFPVAPAHPKLVIDGQRSANVAAAFDLGLNNPDLPEGPDMTLEEQEVAMHRAFHKA